MLAQAKCLKTSFSMSTIEYSSESTHHSKHLPFRYTARPSSIVEKEHTSITTLQALFSSILKIVAVQKLTTLSRESSLLIHLTHLLQFPLNQYKISQLSSDTKSVHVSDNTRVLQLISTIQLIYEQHMTNNEQ